MPFKNGDIQKRQLKQLPEMLCKTSHFRKDEVASLLHLFYVVNQGKMKMERDLFRHTFHRLFDITGDVILDRLFHEFDQDQDQAVSLYEWVSGMSIFLRGSRDERTQFCFHIYNMKNDGYINREEVVTWLKSAIPKSSDEDPEESNRDLGEIYMKTMDKDGDGRISFSDYVKTTEEYEILTEGLGTVFPEQWKIQEFMENIKTEKDE